MSSEFGGAIILHFAYQVDEGTPSPPQLSYAYLRMYANIIHVVVP